MTAFTCIYPKNTTLTLHNAKRACPLQHSMPATNFEPSLHSPQRRSPTTRSHNTAAEIQFGFPTSEQFYADHRPDATTKTIDILGLGQAMIDFSAPVNDSFLTDVNVEKSSRKLITVAERASILERLDGFPYQVTSGGSLSNTLKTLALLGSAAAASGHPDINIAMSGLIGSDPLGSFYTAQMKAVGVDVLSPPTEAANTGTVVVLTSPDAQRTMLSYLGTPAAVPLDAHLEASIARSSVLVIEGYLWELPDAEATIRGAIAAAQRRGTVVAMTAGDAGVVQRHGAEMWSAIDAGIDLLFTNAAEAAELVACAPEVAVVVHHHTSLPAAKTKSTWAAEAAALALGPHCSLVCVTDGCNGSILTALGQLHVVPPVWTESPPVDTCGAGDAYAAGLLYGFLRKFDVGSMGKVAARAASAVIARHGATMNEEAAVAVAATLPSAAKSMVKSFPKRSSEGATSSDLSSSSTSSSSSS